MPARRGRKSQPAAGSRGRQFRPADTPDAREAQLISLAADLAEKQLRDGTASSQVLTHFLKLGSSRERKEQARIENENLLLAAKVDSIKSAQRSEAMFAAAMRAMRTYTGGSSSEFSGFEGFDDFEDFP